MIKHFLVSIVVLPIAIAMLAARDPSPVPALRRAVALIAIGIALYAVSIVYVLPRFG